jgi:hypothetical protein
LGAGVLAGFRFHGSALGARPRHRNDTNVILPRPEEGPMGQPPERQPDSPAYQPPVEATVRRVLARVDPDTLDLVIGRSLADQQPPPRPWSGRQAVAVDGKTLRGTGQHGVGQVHLLAAMDHADGMVLAQRQVDGAPGEVTGFRPLLAGMDLAGVVVTADALHTQREQADYLFLSRATSRRYTRSWPGCHGAASRSWTAPATTATAASRCVPSRSPPSPAWASPTPPRPCGSPAGSGRSEAGAGGP